ncbi:hypothetical protein D3C76_1484050 [compost metagenome]
MGPPEVEVIACHAGAGAEGILATVEQVPLLILQGVDAGQATRCAAATCIHAGLSAGEGGTTLIGLNRDGRQGREQGRDCQR